MNGSRDEETLLVWLYLVTMLQQAETSGGVESMLIDDAFYTDDDTLEQWSSWETYWLYAWKLLGRLGAPESMSSGAVDMHFGVWMCWYAMYLVNKLVVWMMLARSFIKDVLFLTCGTIHSVAEDTKTYTITWLMWGTTKSIGSVVGSIVGSNSFITVNVAHIYTIIVRYRRPTDQSSTGHELDFGMNDQEFSICQCRQVLQANAVKSMKSSSLGTVTDMTDIGLRTYSYGKGMTEERSYESHEWAMDSRSYIALLLA